MSEFIIDFDGREETKEERDARRQMLNKNKTKKPKRALVTGITGQDGSYLADLLVSKGYQVVGLRRRTSTENFGRIQHLLDNELFSTEEFEISDAGSVYTIVEKYKPDGIPGTGRVSVAGK